MLQLTAYSPIIYTTRSTHPYCVVFPVDFILLHRKIPTFEMMIFRKVFPIAASLLSLSSFAQIRTEIYFSSDEKLTDIVEDLGNPLPGTPVMIAQTFVPNSGSYVWYLNESKNQRPAYLDETPKDLHAGIYLEDHGGLIPKITFRDFAEGLAQPRYCLNFCLVDDADNNGFPEFYLTYLEDSDGLDAKPLKVLVYTLLDGTRFTKSKITAWLPFQDGDLYREVKDNNYQKLSAPIRQQAEKILSDVRKDKFFSKDL